MPEIIDDKSEHCIPFLLARLKLHQARHANTPNPPPFFLGLNGIQGAGKTVLVSTLHSTLRSPPYSLPTTTLSLDDIYLTHSAQQHLATTHPSNPLLQHRGQPSTHNLPLGLRVFDALRQNLPTSIPQYDKSAHSGQGDRVPEGQWQRVNTEPGKEVKVVIFEGWCVGFRALSREQLKEKWENAVKEKESPKKEYDGRLGYMRFEDVEVVNDALKSYDALTDQLDALIHIDAENTHFVYDWRQQQERSLLETEGTGMTADQVTAFVDGYYPSYELYTNHLREGVFKQQSPSDSSDSSEGRQLRLIVNADRRVEEVVWI